MLAKKTSKNQVTLPKKILAEIPDTDYFDVSLREWAVVLRPVTVTEPGSRLATIARKSVTLGLKRRTSTARSGGPEAAEDVGGDPCRSGHECSRLCPALHRPSLPIGSSLASRSRSPRRLSRDPR